MPHTIHADASATAVSSFDGLGLADSLLQVLHRLQLTTPTPIQAQAIPLALEGKDVIGIAQTGTGKTYAFGLPMLQRLSRGGGQGLVVLPTRELALQVDESIRKVGHSFGLRTAVLIGGESMDRQKRALALKPHILIVTPGRLIDHLEQRFVRLDKVSILVLDEADRMLDMGFAPQINKILQAVPVNRQTMLFSATMPSEITNIAHERMRSPVRVEIERAGTSSEHVTQELFFVRREDKTRLLDALLAKEHGTVLVFSRTKFGAKRLNRAVRGMGHSAAEIHSNRSLAQRRDALEGFKSGKYRVLIATDIAARGIDVRGISLVINYDLPDQIEDYVHRIGRTGRAGHKGHAISFAGMDERSDVRAIERLIGKALPVSELPVLPPARALPPEVVERPHHRAPRSARPGQPSFGPSHRHTSSRVRGGGGSFEGRMQRRGAVSGRVQPASETLFSQRAGHGARRLGGGSRHGYGRHNSRNRSR